MRVTRTITLHFETAALIDQLCKEIGIKKSRLIERCVVEKVGTRDLNIEVLGMPSPCSGCKCRF